MTKSLPLALLLAAAPALAQRVAPSVYVGTGLGTNLGGLVGAGVEVRVGPYVSTSAALGVDPVAATEDGLEGNPVDFDLGAKVYPFREWLYLGVNYGIVNAEYGTIDYIVYVSGARTLSPLEKTRAFSLTAGARTPAWRGVYASAYAGTTSDGPSNRVFDDFIPRLGLMVGYEL